MNSFFPEIIKSLPRADIPIKGLDAFLCQGDSQQVLFMEFDEETTVPAHSHEAQWGVVLEGEIELTIEGQILNLKKGDTYYISADAEHSAKIYAGYKDMTLFNQKDRYNLK
jgi:quercetin dioxygenase-like cupin family protein